MELSEEVFRPRLIDTTEYVKARLDQIAELLEVFFYFIYRTSSQFHPRSSLTGQRKNS